MACAPGKFPVFRGDPRAPSSAYFSLYWKPNGVRSGCRECAAPSVGDRLSVGQRCSRDPLSPSACCVAPAPLPRPHTVLSHHISGQEIFTSPSLLRVSLQRPSLCWEHGRQPEHAGRAGAKYCRDVPRPLRVGGMGRPRAGVDQLKLNFQTFPFTLPGASCRDRWENK